MRIKQKLIKEINNLYFRDGGKPNDVFPVKNNISPFALNTIIEEYTDFYISDYAYDVLQILNNKQDFRSDLAIELLNKQYNLQEKIKDHFKYKNDSKILRDIIRLLETRSNEVYLVGGCIRDILLNNKVKDYDIVSDTDIDELEILFKEHGYNVTNAGKQFMVMHVSKDGSEVFEIAQFRSDVDNSGGVKGDIITDSRRRDFSVNSLFFNTSTYELKDPNGQGIDDILTRTLRFVGNAKERIIEDPLRVMRFYRFINKGLTPDPKSLRAVRENFEFAVKYTNAERIKNEIERIVL